MQYHPVPSLIDSLVDRLMIDPLPDPVLGSPPHPPFAELHRLLGLPCRLPIGLQLLPALLSFSQLPIDQAPALLLAPSRCLLQNPLFRRSIFPHSLPSQYTLCRFSVLDAELCSGERISADLDR